MYLCTSDTQINGFWKFYFQGFEGPNGEKLVEAEPDSELEAPPLSQDSQPALGAADA